MEGTKENPTAASAQPVVKKARRGVSNATQAVAQLKFHEKDAAQNGLFVGHLENVTLDWSKNDDGKIFTGMTYPRITFHFASNHTNAAEQRHVYQNIMPVESNVNTIEGGTESWKVNNVFRWIKHLLEVYYLKGREFTSVEEDALALNFIDSDENGNYIPVDPQEVINSYTTLFTNAVAMLNGSWGIKEGAVAKPCYKTADGKPISVWMKLLRHKKNKGQWQNVANNGELGFDNFIGGGVIEILKNGAQPLILSLDLSKESITPKEVKKAPTIGVNNMIAGMGGVSMPTIPDFANNGNPAFDNAGVDAPY